MLNTMQLWYWKLVWRVVAYLANKTERFFFYVDDRGGISASVCHHKTQLWFWKLVWCVVKYVNNPIARLYFYAANRVYYHKWRCNYAGH